MSDYIFATGVAITPMQLYDGTWAWVVAEFDTGSDVFIDGAEREFPEGMIGSDDYREHVEAYARLAGLIS